MVIRFPRSSSSGDPFRRLYLRMGLLLLLLHLLSHEQLLLLLLYLLLQEIQLHPLLNNVVVLLVVRGYSCNVVVRSRVSSRQER